MMPRAKKSFGQNWLVDKSVVRKIIEAAEIKPGETVLEVGPGTGVLTQALVDTGARVVAVEADASLIALLREHFGDSIELIEGEALSFPALPLSKGEPSGEAGPGSAGEGVAVDQGYKLVANIPYSITSDFIRRFLTVPHKPTRMVLMVQREVADRILAVPGDMSVLSVVCQLYAQVRRVTNVSKGAFRPIPKVDSAVVRFDLVDPHARWGIDPELVIRLAKRGFSSRRKQLHRNLAGYKGLTSEQVKKALMNLGLDPKIRAEALSMEQWVKLTHLFSVFLL